MQAQIQTPLSRAGSWSESGQVRQHCICTAEDTAHDITGITHPECPTVRYACYTNLAAGPLVAGSRLVAFSCWCVGASISEERFLPPLNIICRANAMAEAAHPQEFLSSLGNCG